MKYILFVFSFLLMSASYSALAQGHYESVTDPQTGNQLYRGDVTFQDLGSFNWLAEGYQNYQPDSEAIAYLKQHLGSYQLVVFLGTWCEDSHLLIPQLKKVLEAAGYPFEALNMVAVDRMKTSPEGKEKQYNVQFVPTLILMRDGKEAGRIVESVPQPLEKELVKMIMQ